MSTEQKTSFDPLIQALDSDGVARFDRRRNRPDPEEILRVLGTASPLQGSEAVDALVPLLTSTWYHPEGLQLNLSGHVLVGGSRSLQRDLLIHHRRVEEPDYLQLFALDLDNGPWAVALGPTRHLLWVDLSPNSAPWQGPAPLSP